MFPKAKQVRVRECYGAESAPYEFDGILVNASTLIALDNGAILDPREEWIEIIKEYPWYPVSFFD